MGFRSLQHSRAGRSTHAGMPARYVPPSGFGHPLGGLLPPSPCRSCFIPAALLGFALRSFPLSKGIRAFPHGWTRLPFHLSVAPTDEAEGRPNRPRFPGFDPSESPWRPARLLAGRYAGCSLGLHPLRACRAVPCPGFRLNSSHTLCHSRRGCECGRRPRVSIGTDLTTTAETAMATLPGFRTFADPHTRAGCHPGYVFTLCRAVHRCRQPTRFGWSCKPRSTGAARASH